MQYRRSHLRFLAKWVRENLGQGAGYGVRVRYQRIYSRVTKAELEDRLAYCWGLILAIYLMGHGLVAVPRKLYRNADIGGRLKRIQGRAPKIYDRLNDAITELDGIEAQVHLLKQRKNAISRDHQEWIEDIAEDSNISGSRLSTSASLASSPTIPAIITDRYLAELSRKINRARHKRVRFIDAWDHLLQEAGDLQAMLDASASKRLDFGNPPPHASLLQRVKILTPYARYLLHIHVIPAFRLALAGLLSLASICIVWSEIIKFVAPSLSIIRLTVVTHRKSGESEVGFIGQVFASIWMLYMCTAALASFDDVKIWGNRALVRRNTYGESATWYSGQIARLTVPLAYNFVTFLPRDVHRETTFYHFLGRLVNLTPLGKGFDYFFPILILIPICASLFNLYGRVKSVFNFGILEDDDEESRSGLGSRGWREGRDLIERELSGRPQLGLSTVAGRSPSPLPAQAQRAFGMRGRPSPLHSIYADSSAEVPSSRQRTSETTIEQRQAQRLADATQAAEEQDENIFQGFAHRVRNTFENVERPEWLADLGKRPKWMGGFDDSIESSGRAAAGRGMGRWFGGRPTDGRVRL